MTVDFGFATVEEIIKKLHDDEDWITVIDDAAFRLEEQRAELAALCAERDALREALEDCHAYFDAKWQEVDRHPASLYCDYVLDIREALGTKAAAQPEEAGNE